MTVNKRFFVRNASFSGVKAESSALKEEEKMPLGMTWLNVASVLCVIAYVSIMAFSSNGCSDAKKACHRAGTAENAVCLNVSR